MIESTGIGRLSWQPAPAGLALDNLPATMAESRDVEAPDAWPLYVHADGCYQLRYPPEWRIDATNPKQVLITPSEGTERLVVGVLPVDPGSAEEAIRKRAHLNSRI